MANKSKTLQYLPFEERIAGLDAKMRELQENPNGNTGPQLRRLHKEQTELLKEIYSNLSPWQTVQVARHPQRPLFGDYLNLMVKEPRELHGDRCFGDDKAIRTFLGQIGREKVMIVGQDKGREIKEKIACNFGCPNPEGYRKALLKMKLAEKYNLPVVTLIDTPGAYPGIGAEERGQAQAIALNLMEMSRLKVPVISIVIGEGGSGGALGIGVGDRMAILEFAYYSVISPEGCAAILWRDGSKTEPAAQALKLTGRDLRRLNLVDEVIQEPLGGAHRNIHDTVHNVEKFITKTLRELKRVKVDDLMEKRYQRLRSIGTDFMIRVSPSSEIEQAPAAAKPIPERLSAKVQIDRARHETDQTADADTVSQSAVLEE